MGIKKAWRISRYAMPCMNKTKKGELSKDPDNTSIKRIGAQCKRLLTWLAFTVGQYKDTKLFGIKKPVRYCFI